MRECLAKSVPEGRLNRGVPLSIVPTGLFEKNPYLLVPAVNCWAIVTRPYGTKMWVRTNAERGNAQPGRSRVPAICTNRPDMVWIMAAASSRSSESRRTPAVKSFSPSHRGLCLLLLIASAVALTSCTDGDAGRDASSAKKADRLQIAAVIANEDQFFRLVELGMKDAATRLDVDLMVGNSQGKLDKEILAGGHLHGPRR